MQKISLLGAAALLAIAPATSPVSAMPPPLPEVEGKDAATLRAEMESGRIYEGLTALVYLDRIGRIDDHGPKLDAVIATMPQADLNAEGKRLHDERIAGKARGPLHGIPILLKDNIEAAGPLPTTAGSLALKDNVTNRDAPLVARLRDAGAIILGKTNLSEWANIRSDNSTSGWSAVGGLTKNPHALDRNSCGSSSGSAAAVAASLAPLAIGTETDGSITCPAGVNGIVGFKPSVGLVSRTHIVPISHSQDTAGPMTLTVRDAAAVMSVIAGSDPADPATAEADARKADYVAALSPDALKGKRIGVMRDRVGDRADVAALFDAALKQMEGLGATLVEIADSRKGNEGLGAAEFEILLTELKADMATYLGSLPNANAPRSLADVLAFNKANPDELKWFGQDIFELAETKGGLDSPAYRAAREKAVRLAGPEGIDRLLKTHDVDLLVGVTNGPAWVSDLVNGDSYTSPGTSQLPAVAGYPHLTVPMGAVEGLPIGLSFIGAKWSDADILAAGYAYEQASRKRVAPTYRASVTP
ncbi:amidase [Sphingopyxis sp. H038]|uniref:amidase n=1 Tax=unclassified Sphingopyxis TaxID=2614943 RepID=UPI0007317A34|nr:MULTISPECIES: amidase [unclassified Sphingopyxis]KTE01134.1 amidase [Sphingopyxis sp. H012]KTE12484.1 amidase [Sphingopyxis sp. H053]KTE14184.1 amidase [Sphingopyxis sp. H093]KTE23400.1 amidase [Sphingopyxis sp. H080]KTE32618.1 amidase [Sphingopyxis sp. H077]